MKINEIEWKMPSLKCPGIIKKKNMMNINYPIKFEPILKDKIWGGEKLKTLFNKKSRTNLCRSLISGLFK